MNEKPTQAPNTGGHKGQETQTSDPSHIRQQRPPSHTQSVQTPHGGKEGQGGGDPPQAEPGKR